LHALAVESEQHLFGLPLLELVPALVPDLHRPAAVLAFGDVAFEVDVRQRVILGLHGEVVHLGVGRQALWHGPRRQHAVALQPEVPVQGPGVVLLHDKARVLGIGELHLRRRLRRDVEVALGAVGRQLLGRLLGGHVCQLVSP